MMRELEKGERREEAEEQVTKFARTDALNNKDNRLFGKTKSEIHYLKVKD